MATFTLLVPITRAALLADLDALWQRFDELVGTIRPGDWSGKLGQHWLLRLGVKTADIGELPDAFMRN